MSEKKKQITSSCYEARDGGKDWDAFCVQEVLVRIRQKDEDTEIKKKETRERQRGCSLFLAVISSHVMPLLLFLVLFFAYNLPATHTVQKQ